MSKVSQITYTAFLSLQTEQPIEDKFKILKETLEN